MPRGGARKGAGRKPKPLAEKIAAGNPGRRPLKKVEFAGEAKTDPKPPEFLATIKRNAPGVPAPVDIYAETVEYLEPSGCLNLIPKALISDYVMAKYWLACAQYDLSRTAITIQNPDKTFQVSSFTEAMLKLQKNVVLTWQPIWDIVARNSEKLVDNPERDLVAYIVGGRIRKKSRGGLPDATCGDTENTGGQAEPGEI
jgi:hypothetical protein